MYSDFNFYTEKYGGKKIKNEVDFKRLAEKSSVFIDMQTMGRLKTASLSEDVLNKVKLCECELTDSFSVCERSTGLVSENNDGYSVTFEKGASTDVHNRKIVAYYLWDTGFLYRGMNK